MANVGRPPLQAHIVAWVRELAAAGHTRRGIAREAERRRIRLSLSSVRDIVRGTYNPQSAAARGRPKKRRCGGCGAWIVTATCRVCPQLPTLSLLRKAISGIEGAAEPRRPPTRPCAQRQSQPLALDLAPAEQQALDELRRSRSA
ncbi:MAG TPA: hypothetical protein VG433_04100 [Pirellulales bacterium]|nr:hypothetical protein [Pirellulales bacterium]